MMTVYIMWERQLKRYWRSKSRIIGSLGQPMLFLIAMGLGFGPIFQAAGQGDYMTFLAPGIIAMSILFTAVFNGIEVIWDRQFGFLKETLVAPVPRSMIMLGKTLGGATVAVIQGIVVLALTYIVGYRIPSVWAGLLGLVFMLGIALLFTSVGIAIASKMQDMHGFQLVMNFLIMPIFLLSGAIFPLNDLPGAMSVITRIDPLTYGVDGLRGALSGLNHFHMLLDFAIIYGLATVVLLIGSYLFSKVEV